MRKVTILCTMLSLLALSACGNTLNGMGHDISKMGDYISDTF